jgi:hypothetical protein
MKTRLEIWIEISQKQALQKIADKRSTRQKKVSMAEIIRDALLQVINNERSQRNEN